MAQTEIRLSTRTFGQDAKNEVLIRFFSGKQFNLRAKSGIYINGAKYFRYFVDTKKTDANIELLRRNGNKPSKAALKNCTVYRESGEMIINDRIITAETSYHIEQKKRLGNILAAIDTAYKNADKSQISKEWLETVIDKVNHPDKYAPKVAKPLTLFAAIDDFIAASDNKVLKNGKPVSKVTKYQYKQMQRYMILFAKKQHKEDFELGDLNTDFYNKYVNFLYKQGLKLNTVGKHIKNLKAVINSLPMAERLKCEFVEKKKCPKLAEDIDNIYLTEAELLAIADYYIETPYLDRVRDQFLLLAWTGCRYSDLDKLTKDNIKTGEDGGREFHLQQKKTGAKVIIPILPEAEKILAKYDYQVPKAISNQKFNTFIKEVCKKIDGFDAIEKVTHTINGEKVTQQFERWQLVTAHTARRSFATNLYKKGYPTIMIMKITGHKTEKSFLTYIKVDGEENAKMMRKKWHDDIEATTQQKQLQSLIAGMTPQQIQELLLTIKNK